MNALASQARAVRTYSFDCDGKPLTFSFPHLPGLTAAENTRELNRAFHASLEARVPGALAAGRVHHIRFSDTMREEPGEVYSWVLHAVNGDGLNPRSSSP